MPAAFAGRGALQAMSEGKVMLVGAGPGDPGLITVRGRQALQQADVVVHDRLVAQELLQLAPPGAELIDVGKAQGKHPVPQGRINELLAWHARRGKNVVRLKGGDPYVFGRGSEEAEYLVARGVAFEVVPGVTSATGALAYAGIPATARDAASCVHIVTGHAAHGGELALDYDALVRAGGTLVFLMAVGTMGQICEGLLVAGMPASMPAAVVQEGSTPRQRSVVSMLGAIASDARAACIESPAVLVVGQVCAKASELAFYDALPLRGKSIVVTRPRERCAQLAGKLQRLGAEVLCMPCIQTRPLPSGPAREALSRVRAGEYAWLVLTSAFGVDCLSAVLEGMRLDARALAPVKLAAIGAGTAAALAGRGLRADLVPARHDSAHLAAELAARCEPGQRVLLLRAAAGAPDVPRALRAAGVACDDVATYETVTLDASASEAAVRVRGGSVDYVAFTSASCVRGFAASVPQADARAFTAACIGPCTQAAAEGLGYRTVTAADATVDALVAAIAGHAAAR